MNTLRRLDVISRRAVRNALVQWRTWACKAGLQFTRLACALPSSRQTQDRALYVVAAACACVALHASVYRA